MFFTVFKIVLHSFFVKNQHAGKNTVQPEDNNQTNRVILHDTCSHKSCHLKSWGTPQQGNQYETFKIHFGKTGQITENIIRKAGKQKD